MTYDVNTTNSAGLNTHTMGLALAQGLKRHADSGRGAALNTTDGFSPRVAEQLAAARERALGFYTPSFAAASAAANNRQTAVVAQANGTAVLGATQFWLQQIASWLPVIALVAGFMFINNLQNHSRSLELAEVDTALLADDLPPEAYADGGFAQFLKTKAVN